MFAANLCCFTHQAIIYFLVDIHSDWNEIESQYSFNLHFSDGCQTLLNMFIVHCIPHLENYLIILLTHLLTILCVCCCVIFATYTLDTKLSEVYFESHSLISY